MALISVYLDTCVLSRVADLRLSEAAAAACAEIASRGDVQVFTSYKTRTEVLKTKDPIRNSMLQFLVALVAKVPIRVLHLSGTFGGAPFGSVPFGGSWSDPLLCQLQQIFDGDDAEHITLAAHAGCHYFLTLDEATVLSRARKHASRLAALCATLTFVNPEELIRRIRTP